MAAPTANELTNEHMKAVASKLGNKASVCACVRVQLMFGALVVFVVVLS